MQCLAIDFQNTLQQNRSADKNSKKQNSNALRVIKQMLQTQCHSEKERNKKKKSLFPNHIFLKTIFPFLCNLTKTSFQLLEDFQKPI